MDETELELNIREMKISLLGVIPNAENSVVVSALGCLCLTLILLLTCILFRKLLLQLGQNLIMNTVFLFAVVLTYVKCLK